MTDTTSNDIAHIQDDVNDLRLKTQSKCRHSGGISIVSVITIVISDLLGGLLTGGLIGYALHKYFDLHLVVVAVFLLLGGIAGLLNMYRSLAHLEGKKNHA